jgi:hypothetical protein
VLDAASATGLNRVIIDVRELDDIDPGLGFTLLDCNAQLERGGGWLRLVYGAGRPGSSLRMLGVHDRVRSSPSREAAGWLPR